MLEQRMAALSEKAMRVLAFATSDNRGDFRGKALCGFACESRVFLHRI